MIKKILHILLVVLPFNLLAQNVTVPFDRVLTNSELIDLLDVEQSPELKVIQKNYRNGQQEKALEALAAYFKERFSERYFFDWKNFESRFEQYNQMYSGREEFHRKEAVKHLELYPAATSWKIGFKNLKGETVTSYPYRHLTRQHKAVSIAFLYYYTGEKKYLDYIPEQAKSLNTAFNNHQVETIEDGNGAYEAYRAGNRMFNWLQTHQILLASNEYSTSQQLEMIRTFLHTAANLYHHNPKYTEGNHQTRGMSALAMVTFLFPEIKGAAQWKELALQRLEEHLEKEIYADGFQFERSVHYHIDDIENYFYPYQLAHLNTIALNPIWETRIKGLFNVLLKMAMPSKNAPVLQDDTDSPWAEFNKIDETMALGAVLFGDPEYVFFASPKVASEYFWFLKPGQLARLKKVKNAEPQLGSCALPETGYYIMRNGWNEDKQYMIISAGLTPHKKDHQHGDMLGVQAYAFGNMVLPNYQVRYYLSDLSEFKNSWVKNVALLDSVPQGRQWKGNKGGSGFGKFGVLPIPKVVTWKVGDRFDLFVGSHDGNTEVETYRTVIFVKDGFWIVRDRFVTNAAPHTTQQVWQGHYSVEKTGKHIRSVFPNGAGLEIIQLADSADKISQASAHGKGRSVFERRFQHDASWITLLFPFEDFEERLMLKDYQNFTAAGWKVIADGGFPEALKTNAQQIIYSKNNYLFFNVSKLRMEGKEVLIDTKSDIWIETQNEKLKLTNCGIQTVEINNHSVEPGETIEL